MTNDADQVSKIGEKRAIEFKYPVDYILLITSCCEQGEQPGDVTYNSLHGFRQGSLRNPKQTGA
jgi:hypothetical protein